ncbi:MAG TPA: Sec-independent protein translocase protein TatB [Rhizomicrobium sp.]|nr:Sec-independent protein translocase protein TatB [Rhizomicrobium sp.]
MFDFFGWKLLIVLGVALVVVGPKDLPKVMHAMGRWAGKARAMANEFKRSFDEMARQTELDELRKEVEALKAKNPLSDIEKTLDEPVDYGIDEPRAGEFQVTDTPVPPQPTSGPVAPEPVAAEPAAQSASERAAS